MRLNSVIISFALPLLANSAAADEQMRPLAISGSWIAAAHYESMTASPDVCMVFHAPSKTMFRSDGEQVEFRVLNEDWSLPAGVHGSIQISIGNFTKSFDISANTDKWVSSNIEDDDVLSIFSAMDKSSSMTVTPGKSKPIVVSLAGSTKATNAFRTCAGIHSNSVSPGSNPFQ